MGQQAAGRGSGSIRPDDAVGDIADMPGIRTV